MNTTLNAIRRRYSPWEVGAIVSFIAGGLALFVSAQGATTETGSMTKFALAVLCLVIAAALSDTEEEDGFTLGRLLRVGGVLAASIGMMVVMIPSWNKHTEEEVSFGTFLSADLHPQSLTGDLSTIHTTTGTVQVRGHVSGMIGNPVDIVTTHFPNATDRDNRKACLSSSPFAATACYVVVAQ